MDGDDPTHKATHPGAEGDRWTRWRRGMAAAQAGDSAAYHELLAELLPEVRRLVRARLADAAMADDVVQEALLSIHRARHTYRPERPFGPWLRAVVRNASIDALRQQRRRGSREVISDGLDATAAQTDAAGDALARIERAQISPELSTALAALPAKQRQALELVHLQGLSVAEAALRAGITPGALKVRVHRGTRALRARLAGGPDSPPRAAGPPLRDRLP
jgi:RNA polymerase sigma factor (sigma-70 family)